jgi:hypothetical protein
MRDRRALRSKGLDLFCDLQDSHALSSGETMRGPWAGDASYRKRAAAWKSAPWWSFSRSSYLWTLQEKYTASGFTTGHTTERPLCPCEVERIGVEPIVDRYRTRYRSLVNDLCKRRVTASERLERCVFWKYVRGWRDFARDLFWFL